MYFHKEARLIYLAHPRTASMATANALKSIGFEKCGGNHHIRLWDRCSPLPERLSDPIPYGENLVTEENRNEWYVFTTIRNHYDAVISWVFRRWRGRVKHGFEVKHFVEALDHNGWVGENSLWSLHSYDVDHIMRYENLQKEFDSVLRLGGLPKTIIEPYNVSEGRKGRHYRDLYIEETKEYVYHRFMDEMLMFGYTF